MRIEEIVLYSFGPFRHQRFQFGPRMTLVVGKNEAGKSTLHAALYAAICGVRRGRGQPRREDQEFSLRHRPWGTSRTWEVGAFVVLDDGRRVELRQGLDGSTASYARDQSGRDLTASILNEGSPDAAIWMGLDRRSFAATACVRQAEVLEVVDDAAALQSHLQRAAAGARKDETAARALARITEFEREEIGLDRANSTKPLNRARQRVALAGVRRERAAAALRVVTEKRADATTAERLAADLGSQIAAVEAGLARAQAIAAASRLSRVRELGEKFPNGSPDSRVASDEVAVEVVRAVEAWAKRPELPSLVGPSAADLKRELSRLPEKSVGDFTPHPSVARARSAHDRAKLARDLHREERPQVPTADSAPAVEEVEVRELADALQAARLPEAAPPHAATRAPRWTHMGRVRLLLLAGASLLVLVGGLAGLTGLTIGYLLAGVGALLGIWMLLAGSLAGTARDRGRAAELRAERRSGDQPEVATAQTRVRELALPEDPGELRRIADTIAQKRRNEEQSAQWSRRHEVIATALQTATADLTAALRERGAEVGDDLESSLQAYLTACEAHRQILDLVNRRPALEERLSYREQAERAAASVLESRATAERLTRDAARACAIDAPDAEAMYQQLVEWLARRKARLAEFETENRQWAEFRALLDGRAVADLAAEFDRLERSARELEGHVDRSQPLVLPADPMKQLRLLRREQAEAKETVAALRAEADVIGRDLPAESAVNDELAEAREELRQIEDLARVLTLTRGFLQRAQDRVHNTLAPVLQGTLDAWLPRITDGRYAKSLVDPQTLTVRVRALDAPWRDVQRLSHGTGEQIYLLLRLAITEHLTRGHESCPLILDDVVVQSDADRTQALLGLLHELSSTRQVILFSVNRDAERWAMESFVMPTDRLVVLDHRAVPP